MINLDDMTALEDNRVFRMEQMPNYSYEKDTQTQIDISIEMNLSQYAISRDGYTFLDWLGDIGGMQGMLISGATVFVSIWNYNQLENYMVSKLFKLVPARTGGEEQNEQN